MNQDFDKELQTLREQLQLITEQQKEILELLEEHAKTQFLYLSIKKIRRFCKSKLGVLTQYPPESIGMPAHYFEAPKNLNLSTLPTISIVTPSFNQGHFIERTIKSVVDQNYPKLEYIVQDGNSKDNTTDILKQYNDKITHWESVTDTGQSNAINLGFKHATGDIMAYLNSDDVLLHGSLHYIADYFQKNPSVDAVYGHRIIINENDREIGRWVLPSHSDKVTRLADYVPQETLFWRRSIWEKAGGKIDESFRFAMDWDLILRFIDAKAKMVRLPRFLGAFRVHSTQKTSAQMESIGNAEMDRLRFRCHNAQLSDITIDRLLSFYRFKHVVLHKAYRLGLVKF